MRVTALVLGFVGAIGAAQADDRNYDSLHRYDSSDYAAQLSYQVRFGGQQTVLPQSSFSFQVRNERATQFGAPAVFRTDFGSSGITRFALNGVDLGSTVLASQQRAGGMLAGKSTAQIAGFVVFGVVAGGAVFLFSEGYTDDKHTNITVAGTGTGSF